MSSLLFRGPKHAHLYSKFRPSPPQEFIYSIIKYMKNKIQGSFEKAIDIGCGCGQSTIVLAPYFKNILGVDVSEAQIEYAKKERSAPNLEYKVSDCRKLPVTSSSVHLATFSQSIHWFNTEHVFTEVKRILVPNGVVAAYGYWIPVPKLEDEEKSQKISCLINEDLHEKHLGKYWNEERYIVKNHYSDICFPFNDIQRMNLTQKSESTLSDYIGYFTTWSAYQKLYNEDSKKAKNILKDFKEKLISILNQNKSSEEIHFPLHTDFFMIIGCS